MFLLQASGQKGRLRLRPTSESGFALAETLGLPPAITLLENLGFQGAEKGGRILGEKTHLY